MSDEADSGLWRRMAMALAALSLPFALVLLALVLLGGIGFLIALLCWALATAGLGLVLRKQVVELRAAIRHAGARIAGDVAQPPKIETPLALELGEDVRRLGEESQRSQRRLAAQVERLAAALDALPDPLILIGPQRDVLQANRAARALFGQALVGRDLAFTLRHPAALEAVRQVLEGEEALRQVEIGLPVPVARDFNGVIARVGEPGADMDAAAPIAALTLQDLTSVRKAEQLRVDFVANASHELRTPLATLIGFIETLQGPARDDPEARERFLGIMREQGNRMARLINDLLSLSRIEMNEHTLPAGRVDLTSVIAAAADTAKLQAAPKAMRVSIVAPADLPAVVGEHDELVQVFQNLIDNAVKYGRPNTEVRVELKAGSSPLGPTVTVSVRDQGEGIAREHLPRLTERFYRVDSARSRQLGGTGLGLAIVKHIVNRHRGSLAIESVVGEGSCFTITLPAATI